MNYQKERHAKEGLGAVEQVVIAGRSNRCGSRAHGLVRRLFYLTGANSAGRIPNSNAQVWSVKDFQDRALTANNKARPRAGGLAAIPDQNAIHKDLFDSCGQSRWIPIGRVIHDSSGIEEHKIGGGAFPDDSALLPAEPLRREGSHFA